MSALIPLIVLIDHNIVMVFAHRCELFYLKHYILFMCYLHDHRRTLIQFPSPSIRVSPIVSIIIAIFILAAADHVALPEVGERAGQQAGQPLISRSLGRHRPPLTRTSLLQLDTLLDLAEEVSPSVTNSSGALWRWGLSEAAMVCQLVSQAQSSGLRS